MSAKDTIRELLHRLPFKPFRILTTCDESFVVRNPDLVALMKSEIFIAQPNSDRRSYVPWLHVAAVDMLSNGRATDNQAGRGKRRR
ncbi:MAG: hypothetical protein HUU22_16345 [Phycisphaerae bacterium]|nr:hypothetical protein [Phycisphaerae bacterium]NUQ47591.1 hypothetical protein [Phycisphaerae bacterium]